MFKADPKAKKPKFDWDMKQVDKRTLRISIEFEKADKELVSDSGAGDDQMRILFEAPSQIINCPALAD